MALLTCGAADLQSLVLGVMACCLSPFCPVMQ